MDFDTNDFDKDVLEKSRSIPVVVDFWAEWCAPCKVIGPVLEKLAQKPNAQWILVKVDTEKFPAIAATYSIRSIPNVKLFVDGQIRDEFVGALPETQIVEWLHKSIPGKYEAQLEGARHLLINNRPVDAREMLEFIVAAESDNDQATTLLAQTYLGSDPDRAVKIVESISLGSQEFEEADAIRTFAEMFKRAESRDAFPQDAVRDLYTASITKVRSNDFVGALDGFIEVIRKHRNYDDDGSRKACIAMFKLIGEDHEITRKYRPMLGAALY